MLLPSGGAARVAPAPAPHRALALDALAVLRILRDRPRDAGLWGEPAFAREVESIRRQLAPIRDRRGLASSYGREAFRMRSADDALGLPLTGARPADRLRRALAGARRRRAPATRWTSLVTGRA